MLKLIRKKEWGRSPTNKTPKHTSLHVVHLEQGLVDAALGERDDLDDCAGKRIQSGKIK